MGTPLPENPVGSDCINCWGTGKPFGIGQTPEIVTIQLFDLQEGDFFEPVVGAQALFPTQLFQTDLPCIWFAESLTIAWELFFLVAETILLVTAVETDTAIFISELDPPCSVNGSSILTVPTGRFTFGGTFELTFSEIFT